jgi:feruloyl esterase
MRDAGASRTRSFARLFVAPGMQHCQGGLAPNAFGQAWAAPGLDHDPRHDIRSALEAWVERRHPPTAIVAAKYKDDRIGGALIATQELLAYPAPAGAIRASGP